MEKLSGNDSWNILSFPSSTLCFSFLWLDFNLLQIFLFFLSQGVMCYQRLASNSLCSWRWLSALGPPASNYLSAGITSVHYPHLVYIVLEIEPRASCILDNHSTKWAPAPGLGYYLWIAYLKVSHYLFLWLYHLNLSSCVCERPDISPHPSLIQPLSCHSLLPLFAALRTVFFVFQVICQPFLVIDFYWGVQY